LFKGLRLISSITICAREFKHVGHRLGDIFRLDKVAWLIARLERQLLKKRGFDHAGINQADPHVAFAALFAQGLGKAAHANLAAQYIAPLRLPFRAASEPIKIKSP